MVRHRKYRRLKRSVHKHVNHNSLLFAGFLGSVFNTSSKSKPKKRKRLKYNRFKKDRKKMTDKELDREAKNFYKRRRANVIKREH